INRVIERVKKIMKDNDKILSSLYQQKRAIGVKPTYYYDQINSKNYVDQIHNLSKNIKKEKIPPEISHFFEYLTPFRSNHNFSGIHTPNDIKLLSQIANRRINNQNNNNT